MSLLFSEGQRLSMMIAEASGPSNDHTRQLIEGIVYSRWLIKAYHAVPVGILLIFTTYHWISKLRRRRVTNRLNNAHDTGGTTSSSSSSTLGGNATPPGRGKTGHTINERTLLSPRQSRSEATSSWTRMQRKFRAVGMYQPPRIPIIHKTLPSNATTLLILLFLGLNIFYATYDIKFNIPLAFVPADRAGLLFVANLPWLYLLGAKNQPIRLLTGYSYENINILHRRLGEWLCLLAVFHTAGMFTAWYFFFRPDGLTLYWFLTRRLVMIGIGAFLCYELLFLTSLASFRAWWYEIFLGSHVVLQAGALILIFFHFHTARVYVGISSAIFLVDRLIYRIIIKSTSFKADLTPMEDGETVLVSAGWPLFNSWSSFLGDAFGKNTRQGWETTEHVFLTVPALSRKHIIQAHPFTIASAAPKDSEHAWFNLIIRAHDGFTRDLVEYARGHSAVNIRLDGPYGSLHALEMLRESNISLLVVGGSGIAVAYPLIWALLHEGDAEQKASRKVGLVWIVHEASHVDWIGHERLKELQEKGLDLCLPAPTSKAGRLDISTLVEDMTSKMQESVLLGSQRVGVVVSGPDSMNRATRNVCASMAWQGLDINVSVEKYGW
ncbi:hypothetical protein LTR78_001107 [Recurvomyces mirabilis]|uniref:FAD-binding FR-type domain-containing protein n=1 Tax=Recurvomyces mirabilis TaxID=574656 RepID=A0AAE0WWA9_9PEZI|nr:hypothetical protein LTR78_001107 [Recurvomyces mirabilis]KAK5159079.1 hypothetical protein LTS14_003187 [Recurvomyces mirabilis]